MIIDIASFGDRNVGEKGNEKVETYQDLKRGIRKLWNLMNAGVILVVVGALGSVSKEIGQYLEQIKIDTRIEIRIDISMGIKIEIRIIISMGIKIEIRIIISMGIKIEIRIIISMGIKIEIRIIISMGIKIEIRIIISMGIKIEIRIIISMGIKIEIRIDIRIRIFQRQLCREQQEF